MSRKRHEDPSPSGPAEGRDHGRQVSPGPKEGEVRAENVLRPRSFAEFVGQEKLKSNLKVFVQAAKQRGTVLDHVLFCGPPGLGKTTLAYIIANELGSRIHVTSGPAVDHKGVLAGLLTNLDEGDVLFIDEIHRLMPVVEENLYPAMEEYRLDVLIGEGPHARAMTLPLPKFTLVGATTRTGLLTSPMRDRFGVVGRVEYYAPEELTEIVQRSAGRLEVGIASDGAAEIGGRARGTPRIANRLLRRVWDFAVVDGRGRIDLDISKTALARLEVDSAGLDGLDRRLLHVIIGSYDGGPVGVDALAASLSEERHTLEEVVEPYLLQQGFVHRTPRGRVATKKAYNHLGLPEPGSGGSAAGRQEHLL